MIRVLLIVAAALAATAPARAQGPRLPAVFVPRLLVCPDDPTPAPAQPGYDEAACVDTGIHDVDPQGRTIWLRARVTLPDDMADAAPLAVLIAAMASSEVYWNGARLGANGRVAGSREDETPGRMDAEIFLPAELIEPGENLLAIRMSGHHAMVRAGTPVHFLIVSQFGRTRAKILLGYVPALVAAGALLLAAAFFLAAFAGNRRELSALLLSLVALFAVGQLAAEAGRGIIAYPYHLHVPRLIVVDVFAGLFAITLNAFVVTRFKVRRPRAWMGAAAVLVLGLAPFVPGFDGKALLALFLGAGVALAALAAPAWRGQPGARLTALGLAAFVALMFARPHQFLDQDFFFAVSALMGLLFVDQIIAMRRDRAARVDAQQRSARLELELLRRGVAPHFLMNTLNSLAEWVESDPKTGVRMIAALGEQMRALGAIGERDLIPLTEEIDLVRSFLDVMSYRADASFELQVDGAPGPLSVPPGILHTLAENAFSHNRYAAGGVFRLSVVNGDAAARLEFVAPAGDATRPRAGGGEGHAYVRGRLGAAFGERARFEAGPDESGSWRSVIELPRGAP